MLDFAMNESSLKIIKNKEDQYNLPYYQDCIDFCANWDQKSFDPEYKTKSLEHFVPMIEKVFSKEPKSFV